MPKPTNSFTIGPGEILVRLPTDGAADITLLRNPQQDMAVAIDSSRTEKDVPDALADLLRTLTNASTIRRLAFNSFKDLHAFQLAVTGFQVNFDGYVFGSLFPSFIAINPRPHLLNQMRYIKLTNALQHRINILYFPPPHGRPHL